MKQIRWILCLTAIALLGVFAPAQTTGTIQGLVTDKTGAVVQGATITIVLTTTNQERGTTADSAGRYSIPFVQPGNYTVSVDAKGFRSAKQENILVQVAETRPVDFKLEVGTVSQTIEVSATTENLDVDTSSLGQTIQSESILQLPDQGRNIFDFALLVPGVNNVGNASTPHIGGSRNGNNEQSIDGMTNILPENNVGNNSSAYTPVEDSIQEINVQTSVLPAESGRFSGGSMSLITKSGTNLFHGSFYEFIQNGALDAVPFGSPGVKNTGKQPEQHQYETGGTVGGPVMLPHLYDGHNKTFFFFDYENRHSANGQTSTYSVPNPNWLSGDFTSLFGTTTPSLYDPDSAYLVSSGSHKGAYARCAYGSTASVDGGSECANEGGRINMLPASRISKVTQKALGYFPAPNVSGAGTYNNYQNTGSVPDTYWHFDTKVDENVTKGWHSFLRYSMSHEVGTTFNDYNNAASPGNYGGAYHTTSFSGSFNNTVTFTPTLLGEFRYGLSKTDYNRIPVGGVFDPATLGFDAGFSSQSGLEGKMFPHFGFGGNGGFSDLGPLGYEQFQEDPLAQSIAASLVKISHGHSIKVGGEFRALRLNFYQWSYPSGTFSADDSWTRQFPQSSDSTGFSVASLLLGLPSGGNISEDEKSISNSTYWAFFGQDDWKVAPKLTLNIGLRYDFDVPHTEQNNQLSYWDPNAASPIGSVPTANGVICPACGSLKGAMNIVNTPGAKYGKRQGPTPKNDWGPRFGLAYNVTPKVVIRAGAGIVFQASALQAAGTTGSPGNQGFATQTNFQPSFTNQDSLPIASLYSPDPNLVTSAQTPFPAYNTPQGHQAACIASVKCQQGIDLGTAVSNSYFDSYRTPYSIQWNGNVQFAMPFNIKLELGYLANKGVFLIDGDPGKPYDQLSTGTLAQYGCTPGAPSCSLQNQVANPFFGIIGTFPFTLTGTGLGNSPTVTQGALLKHYPQYSAVYSYRKAGAASMYNAFTLRATKNLTHGLTFTLAFTDGREFDNAASPVGYLGPTSQTYADQYNPKAEWGIGSQNISYSIAGSFQYELPFGHGKMFANSGGGAADRIIGGWQISGIENWSTGVPIVLGSVDNGTTKETDQSPFNQRPAWDGRTAKVQSPTYRQWFNPNVFSMPVSFAIGNAPRALNDVNNPSYQNLDFQLAKNTPITEHIKTQFRLEMFNAFNHPVLGSPNTGLQSGQFGVISGYSSTARKLQVAAKINF